VVDAQERFGISADGTTTYDTSMSARQNKIRIEFYGIPRQRVGSPGYHLPVNQQEIQLSELIEQLTQRFPSLQPDCFSQGLISPNVKLSLDGDHFVTDIDAWINIRQTLLVMSADAGG